MGVFDEILKQQHRVEARANSLTTEMLAPLLAALDTLTGQLASLRVRFLTAPTWQEEALNRKKAFLEAHANEVKGIISQIYASNVAPAAFNAGMDVMSYATAQTVSTAKAAAPISVDLAPRITMPMVEAWAASTTIEEATLTEWLARMEATSAQRIIAAGRQATVLGLPVQQAASLLRQHGIEGTRPQIASIARTFLLAASNHAREQATEVMGQDFEYSWQYVATLDGRTCPICGADDGKIFQKGEPRPIVPRHINCRCTYIPITSPDTLRGVTRPAVKHEAHTVHHRDGSTSTEFNVSTVEHVKENYAQWIGRQLEEDPAFVRDILDKTRFELFRSGTLTLEKMVVDGRIKRLADL